MFVNWLNPLNILYHVISAFAVLALPLLLGLGLLAITGAQFGSLLTINLFAGVPAFLIFSLAKWLAIGLVGLYFVNTFLVTIPLVIVVVIELIVGLALVFANALLNLGINIPNVFTVWVLLILDVAIPVLLTMMLLPVMIALDLVITLVALPIIAGLLQLGLVVSLFANPITTLLAILAFAAIGLAAIPAFLAGLFFLAQAWLPLTFSLPAFLAYLVFANPVWMLAQCTGLIPIIGWAVQLVTDWAYMLLGLWVPGMLTALSFALFLHLALPLVFSAFVGVALLLATLPVMLLILPLALLGSLAIIGLAELPVIATTLLALLPVLIFGLASLAVIVWFLAPIFLQLMVNPLADFAAFVISVYTMFLNPVLYWAFWIIFIPLTIGSFVGMFINWLNPLNILFNAISAFAIIGLPVLAVLSFLAIELFRIGSLITWNPLLGIVAFGALTISKWALIGLVAFYVLNTLAITIPLVVLVGIVDLVIGIALVFANALLNLGINVPNVFTVWVLQILMAATAVVLTLMALPIMLVVDLIATLIAIPFIVGGLQIGLLAGLLSEPLRALLAVGVFAAIGLATIPVFLTGIFMLAQAWLPLTFSLPAFLAYLVFGNPIWMLAQWTGLIPIIGWIVQLVTDWAYMLLGLWLPGILSAVSFSIFLTTMLPLVFSSIIGGSLLLAVLPVLLLALPIALIGGLLILGLIALPVIAGVLLSIIPTLLLGIGFGILIIWFLAPIFLQLMVNPLVDLAAFVVLTYTMFNNPVFYWAFALFTIPMTILSFNGMFLNWLNPLNIVFYLISWFAILGAPLTALFAITLVEIAKIASLILPFGFNFGASLVAWLALTAAQIGTLLTFISMAFIRPFLMVSLPLLILVVVELIIAAIVVFANALLNLGINVPNVLAVWVLDISMTIIPIVFTMFNFALMLAFDGFTLLWRLPIIGLLLTVGLGAAILAHPFLSPLLLLAQGLIGLTAIGTFLAGIFMIGHLWLPHTFGVVAFLWFLIFANPVFMLAQWTGLIPIIGWAVQLVTDWVYMPIALWGTGIIAALTFSIEVMGILFPTVVSGIFGLSLLLPLAPLAILPLLLIVPLLLSIVGGVTLLSTALTFFAFIMFFLPFTLIPLATALTAALLALPLLAVLVPMLLSLLPLALPLLALGLPLLLGLGLLPALVNGLISALAGIIPALLTLVFGRLPLDILGLLGLGLIPLVNLLAGIGNLIPGLLHKLITLPLWLLSLLLLPLTLLIPLLAIDAIFNLVASRIWQLITTLSLLAKSIFDGFNSLLLTPLLGLLLGLPLFLGSWLLNSLLLGPVLGLLLPLIATGILTGLMLLHQWNQLVKTLLEFGLSLAGLVLPLLNLLRRVAFWALLAGSLLLLPLKLLGGLLGLTIPLIGALLLGKGLETLIKLLLLPGLALILPILAALLTLPAKLLLDALLLPLILGAAILLPWLLLRGLGLLKLIPDLLSMLLNPLGTLFNLPGKIGNLIKDLLGPLSWLPVDLITGLINLALFALPLLGLLLPIGPIKWLPVLLFTLPALLNGLKTLGSLALGAITAGLLPLIALALAGLGLLSLPLISGLLTLPLLAGLLSFLTDIAFNFIWTVLPALLAGLATSLLAGLPLGLLFGLPLLVLNGLNILRLLNRLFWLTLPGLLLTPLAIGAFLAGLIPTALALLALPLVLFVKPIFDLIKNTLLPFLAFLGLRTLARLLGFVPITNLLNPLNWIKSLVDTFLPLSLLKNLLRGLALLGLLPVLLTQLPILTLLGALVFNGLNLVLGPLFLFGVGLPLLLLTAALPYLASKLLSKLIELPLKLLNGLISLANIAGALVIGTLIRGLRLLLNAFPILRLFKDLLLGLLFAIPAALGLIGLLNTLLSPIKNLLLGAIELPLLGLLGLAGLLTGLDLLRRLANGLIAPLIVFPLTVALLAIPASILSNLLALPGFGLAAFGTLGLIALPFIGERILHKLADGVLTLGTLTGLTFATFVVNGLINLALIAGELLTWRPLLLNLLGTVFNSLLFAIPALGGLKLLLDPIINLLGLPLTLAVNTLLPLLTWLLTRLGLPLLNLLGFLPVLGLNLLANTGLATILGPLAALPILLLSGIETALELLLANRLIPLLLGGLTAAVLPVIEGIKLLGKAFFSLPVLAGLLLTTPIWVGLPLLNGLRILNNLLLPLAQLFNNVIVLPLQLLANSVIANLLSRLLTAPLHALALGATALVTLPILLGLGLLLPALGIGVPLVTFLGTLLGTLPTLLANGLTNLLGIPLALGGLWLIGKLFKTLSDINIAVGVVGLLEGILPVLMGLLLTIPLVGIVLTALSIPLSGLMLALAPFVLLLPALGQLLLAVPVIVGSLVGVGLPLLGGVLWALAPLLRSLLKAVGLLIASQLVSSVVNSLSVLRPVIILPVILPITLVLPVSLLSLVVPVLIGGVSFLSLPVFIGLLVPIILFIWIYVRNCGSSTPTLPIPGWPPFPSVTMPILPPIVGGNGGGNIPGNNLKPNTPNDPQNTVDVSGDKGNEGEINQAGDVTPLAKATVPTPVSINQNDQQLNGRLPQTDENHSTSWLMMLFGLLLMLLQLLMSVGALMKRRFKQRKKLFG